MIFSCLIGGCIVVQQELVIAHLLNTGIWVGDVDLYSADAISGSRSYDILMM